MITAMMNDTKQSDDASTPFEDFPFLSLERCTSNPLTREYSNISSTSQEGHPHLVPFGRGHQHIVDSNIHFSATNSFLFSPKEVIIPIRATPKIPRNAPRNDEPLEITQNNNEQTMDRNDNIHVTQQPERKYGEVAKFKVNKKKVQMIQKRTNPDIASMDVADIIQRNLNLNELLNNSLICKLIKHGAGSRYIQQKIHNASPPLMDKILNHIIFQKRDILECAEDIYGNYVVQIMFENATKAQHELLIDHLLKGNVYKLSRSLYGCRVIQKAFDCIPKKDSIALIQELNTKNIRALIIGHNANHVIQKILTLGLDVRHIQFVIDCINKDICFYSQHIFGCRIVQSIIKFYGDINDKQLIYKHFISTKYRNNDDNILVLCVSKYGNYVIQDILQLKYGDDECKNIKNIIIKKIFKHIWDLSKNKFGSNVVEKCLIHSNEQQIDFLLKQITGKKKDILIKMVHDKFANYVIQKLLICCNKKQETKLIHYIQSNVTNLQSTNYGKHIMDKIKQIQGYNKYNKFHNY